MGAAVYRIDVQHQLFSNTSQGSWLSQILSVEVAAGVPVRTCRDLQESDQLSVFINTSQSQHQQSGEKRQA
jgi:hypothetical protein